MTDPTTTDNANAVATATTDNNEAEPLIYRMHLPVLSQGAPILAQALDFGKPLKDTTRHMAVTAPTQEQCRAFDFPVAVLEVTITAPHVRSLRVAVHGFLEQLELSLKTLEQFAPAQHLSSSPTTGAGMSMAASASMTFNHHHQQHNTNNALGRFASVTGTAAAAGTISSSSFERSGSGGQMMMGERVGSSAVVVQRSPLMTAAQPLSFGGAPPLQNLSLDGEQH